MYIDDGGDEAPTHERNALISAKDETIATLREQLEAERQAHAEARRIIAGLVERIPAIEAPASEATDAEATEAPQTPAEEPDRAEPHSATGKAQEGARRPWWRFWR